MKSITRLVTAVGGSYVRGRHPVSRAGRQADRPGQGAAFNGKKIEMKDKERSLTSCLSRRGKSSRPPRTA